MAATGTPTPNIGLRVPIGTDPASVDDINYNSNLLDTKLGPVGSDSVQDQIDALNSKIPTIEIGQFQVATINGSKAIQRTDLNTAPPDLRYCSYTVISHGQNYNPTSIEVDSANTLVVTSTGVQTITVRWFYMKY